MDVRNKIKIAASALLGKPYVWGGESDSEGGYDCSGFVYTVLKSCGFRVGRTTAQGYYRYFQSRPHYKAKAAKCGDLIFFGKDLNHITHIAIAKDSNSMWESIGGSKNTKTNPGRGVVISSITRRKDILCVVDIVDDERVYYPQYVGTSSKIDVIFCEIGAPYGNVEKRKPTAIHNGITDYKGTLSQNLKLIKLAKEGKLYR